MLASCTAPAGPAPGTHTLRSFDGTPIVVEVLGSDTRPALVFVHCWAGNRQFWKEQVADLSRDHPVSLEAARLLPGRVAGIVAVDTLHDAALKRWWPRTAAPWTASWRS